MKKIILVIAMALAATAMSAQTIIPSSSYKELKKEYRAKDYHKSQVDVYSPFWMGFSSLVAPGTGQLIAHETGRGWAFIGAEVAASMVQQAGLKKAIDNIQIEDGEIVEDSDGNIVFKDEAAAKKGFYIFLAGAASQMVVSIWSCIDAVKVAKVKNQYFQDLQAKYGFEAKLYPSVNMVQTANGYTAAPGMTFAVQF